MTSTHSQGSVFTFARKTSMAVAVGALLPMAVAAQSWHDFERPSRDELPLPKNLHAPVAKAMVGDPTGDTFGSGTTQADITELSANIVGNALEIGVTFAGAISAPDSGQPNAVDGLIDIDTDQDGSTGLVPFVDLTTGNPTTGMGDEYHVDLFDYDGEDSTVSLVDDVANPGATTRVAISFTSNSLTVTIPLVLLGEFGADGAVNIAAVMGSITEPTDVAPNSGSLSTDGGGTGNPETILLQDGRFEVGVTWFNLPDFPEAPAFPSQELRTDDSALFYFRNPDNLEFLIKVIDGCTNNGRYWVFFAGATDVGFTVSVTDTETSEVRTYENMQGMNADAVTDTQAFTTCP